MARITTPVEGFTGVVVGVTFADGKGETDDQSAIAYFTRHGYTVEAEKPAPKKPTAAEKAAAEKAKADKEAADKAEAERLAAEKEAAEKAAAGK